MSQIAAAMINFGIPSSLKAYVDLNAAHARVDAITP
jgi:FMN-dependent NADH-azoreductase